MSQKEDIFERRMRRHLDELKWLYMELYDNEAMLAELVDEMHRFYLERSQKLRNRDLKREQEPDWFKGQELLGMMLYVENFGGTLQGVREKLPYLKRCGVNCLHLMPFLDSPEGRSDGGYAVADFRKVRPDLGTMEDLELLTEECHRKNMNVCMDFVMNHTSEEHEWAKKARSGEEEYKSRYFFYENDVIPKEYEKTVPQVFPTTAPGNFTYLEDAGNYVMTTFYPYQWDLNYKNPRVFNEMMYNFLYLANRGMDIIRIDAVPYIWKELGTRSRNLPKVHTIVRMMRMIGEIVCPGVVLLGEVVMEPERVVPYFGTVEKPECHMLYNVTTMATTWNSVATGDVRLLRKQMDIVSRLPGEYTFLNYLRCHDDIGWGLDYDTLGQWGMQEVPHKRFLNDFFQGKYPGSLSRGELYNDDPVTQDARFCGTTASMCGLEVARGEDLEKALRLDIMLHAYILTQAGIPMLYSGDEVGQLNDASYKEDPRKREDSRYLHRGPFRWEAVEDLKNPKSVAARIFNALKKLEEIRRREPVFGKDAVWFVQDVGEDGVLCIRRETAEEKFLSLFNFNGMEKILHLQEAIAPRGTIDPGETIASQGTLSPQEALPSQETSVSGAGEGYRDLLTGESVRLEEVKLPGYGFLWAKCEK